MPDLIGNLSGRKVLVIGGTRGIGSAISLRLAAAGASVIATYVRDGKSASGLLSEAATKGLDVAALKADVTRDAGVADLMAHVAGQFVPLNAVVFSAATGVHRPVAELTGRHFDFTFALNARAFLELANKLSVHMPPGGTIVALSSEGAQRAIATYALVGASKAALESLVRNLAVELAPRGLTVNALSPGAVLTDAWKAMPNAEARIDAEQRRSPRHRLTELSEVADAALFLCSPAARGISGQVLVVDGGTRVAI